MLRLVCVWWLAEPRKRNKAGVPTWETPALHEIHAMVEELSRIGPSEAFMFATAHGPCTIATHIRTIRVD